MKTYDEMIEFARYSHKWNDIDAEGYEAYPQDVWAMAEMIAFMFEDDDKDTWDVASEIMDI